MNYEGEEPLREYDAKGQLVAAGYQWLEAKKSSRFVRITFVLIPFVFAIEISLWYALDTIIYPPPQSLYMQSFGPAPRIAWNIFLLAVPVVLGVLLVRFMNRDSWRRRALLIHREGFISAPHGLSNNQYIADTRPITYRIDSPIASIEMRDNRDNYPVNVYFSDGTRLLVDVNSSRDDARIIAVQLTRALQEIRTDAQRPPDTTHDVIN